MLLLHRFARDIAPESTERINCLELLEVLNAPSEYDRINPFLSYALAGGVKYYVILPFYKGDASENESHQLEGSEDSDTSYLGDVESLTSDSAQPTSDSEDDLSEMFSKGNFKKSTKIIHFENTLEV